MQLSFYFAFSKLNLKSTQTLHKLVMHNWSELQLRVYIALFTSITFCLLRRLIVWQKKASKSFSCTPTQQDFFQSLETRQSAVNVSEGICRGPTVYRLHLGTFVSVKKKKRVSVNQQIVMQWFRSCSANSNSIQILNDWKAIWFAKNRRVKTASHWPQKVDWTK